MIVLFCLGNSLSPDAEQSTIINEPIKSPTHSPQEFQGSPPVKRKRSFGKISTIKAKINLKPTTTSCLKWSVNRLKLNKTIYKHEVANTFECRKKLEVHVGSTFNPKLTLILYPCGLEKDVEAENVTLVIHVSAPKKAPPLEGSASVILLVKVMEGDGGCELLNETACEVNLNSRVVRKFGIISHEALKKSDSEMIDFEAKLYHADSQP